MGNARWIEEEGSGPLMAVAVHAGPEVRGQLFPLLAIDDTIRSQEEDVYTPYWARVAPTWPVPTRSRFETDLHRHRSEAVYTSPEVAWGLRVWNGQPDEAVVERSPDEWDAFHRELGRLLDRLARQFDRFVVLDLRSYNYRRAGCDAEPADPQANPEVNVGIATLDRQLCGALVERFIGDLRSFDSCGRHLAMQSTVTGLLAELDQRSEPGPAPPEHRSERPAQGEGAEGAETNGYHLAR